MSDNDTSPPVIDLDNLERLARAATPGPWECRRGIQPPGHVVAPDLGEYGPRPFITTASWGREADAQFIAVANPAVVLELVRRLRAAGELVAALQDEVDRERAHRARRDAGGQQVPNHGDFSGAAPSTLGRLDWWARTLRGALGATSTDR